MTLACEDAYSKLVEVVTVADVSDEFVPKARFGQDFKFTFSRDADVWLRF